MKVLAGHRWLYPQAPNSCGLCSDLHSASPFSLILQPSSDLFWGQQYSRGLSAIFLELCVSPLAETSRIKRRKRFALAYRGFNAGLHGPVAVGL